MTKTTREIKSEEIKNTILVFVVILSCMALGFLMGYGIKYNSNQDKALEMGFQAGMEYAKERCINALFDIKTTSSIEFIETKAEGIGLRGYVR